jgi:hypothetical protein
MQIQWKPGAATRVCCRPSAVICAGGPPRRRVILQANVEDEAATACPFLRTPKYRKRGWRKEFNFGQDAAEVQGEILGGEGL